MARQRGRNYQKNLVKRQRNALIVVKPPDKVHCFSCGIIMGELKVTIGDKLICSSCDGIMDKHGYIQLSNFKRLYPDGMIKIEHYEIRDVLTGRID